MTSKLECQYYKCKKKVMSTIKCESESGFGPRFNFRLCKEHAKHLRLVFEQ